MRRRGPNESPWVCISCAEVFHHRAVTTIPVCPLCHKKGDVVAGEYLVLIALMSGASRGSLRELQKIVFPLV